MTATTGAAARLAGKLAPSVPTWNETWVSDDAQGADDQHAEHRHEPGRVLEAVQAAFAPGGDRRVEQHADQPEPAAGDGAVDGRPHRCRAAVAPHSRPGRPRPARSRRRTARAGGAVRGSAPACPSSRKNPVSPTRIASARDVVAPARARAAEHPARSAATAAATAPGSAGRARRFRPTARRSAGPGRRSRGRSRTATTDCGRARTSPAPSWSPVPVCAAACSVAVAPA